MANTTTPPRILRIAVSTYITALECSVDRTVVTVQEHRARCAYGHRWVKDGTAWRSVGKE